jgi:hypothetical protein
MWKTEELVPLLKTMSVRFDSGELRKLSAELGVNYEELRGERLSEKVLALLEDLNRNERLEELLTCLGTYVPVVDWQQHRPRYSSTSDAKRLAKPSDPSDPFMVSGQAPVIIVPKPLEELPDHSSLLMFVVFLLWFGMSFYVFSGNALTSAESVWADPDVDEPMLTLEQFQNLFLVVYLVFTLVLLPTSYTFVKRKKEKWVSFLKEHIRL